ncbi:hypothetical protein Celal_2274 [Cellulophaga algicola DSM 14237]|uniref:Uncharacterized protein n=1 Tax=Cellulophaga algicola (strain DSM 14237 / IC166 / ACAM 630) TaxID=688270 RepID=E6X6M8_CELAD|nr:hypothetical protein Celal_2274 [Cellulophaga algicola DSM 14237]
MKRGNWKIRICIGLAIIAFAFIKKYSITAENLYTDRE